MTTAILGSILPLSGEGLDPQQAVRLDGNRIAEVGGSEIAADATETFDFGARSVLPGFIDAHTHGMSTVIGRHLMVDCVTGIDSLAGVIARLHESLDQTNHAGWVIARTLFMFDELWPDAHDVSRHDLDAVSTTIPIALRTGHLSVMNTAAIEALGLNEMHGEIQGSGGPVTIYRDQDGYPNGRVTNFDTVMPLTMPDRELAREALREGLVRVFTARGVTTMADMTEQRAAIDGFVDLIDEGAAPMRIYSYLMAPRMMPLADVLRWQELGIEERPDQFEVRGLKMFADGGFSSADASTHFPYLDEATHGHGYCGKLTFSDEELLYAFEETAKRDMQLSLHANGEPVQEQICRIVAGSSAYPAKYPIRLEHAGNFMWNDTTPDVWRSAGAIPVTQAIFLPALGATVPKLLGPKAAEHGRFPYRTLLDQGWPMSGSSDGQWSVSDEVYNPFHSMWCVMKRETIHGDIMDPEERLDLESALKVHTINGARSLSIEDRVGTLEPGKFADIVVLDRDITDGVDADNIRDVQVDYVFSDGRLVYQREGAAPYTTPTA
ncbi:amidohydrolase [Microbacterium gorillae]|uniref:amidohydrolase n=1 Tax=Microbacterium gorillae TaxID=1231063 RepID=UPI00058F10C6|nr:amidohydrolase family protein [Microbacterium gorillae]